VPEPGKDAGNTGSEALSGSLFRECGTGAPDFSEAPGISSAPQNQIHTPDVCFATTRKTHGSWL
jgi:hypothetical protein